MNLSEQMQTLSLSAHEEIGAVKTLADLEALEIKYLGRKGELAGFMKNLGQASEQERPKLGQQMNEIKTNIEKTIASARQKLTGGALRQKLESEQEDVTEPGIHAEQGHLHLVSQAIKEITDIFHRIGFSRTHFPEVEWDWFAFEALNMPKEHPARDEWETFFMDAPSSKKGKMVLTPHATSGTSRQLAEKKLPIRTINIAKTYRRQIDVTHVPMFHQFDGVYVDKGVSLAHLRGVLDFFAREFFGAGRKTRLRPFHFRFTEPSFEVDVSCGICNGSGKAEDGSRCRMCKQGWHELGGAGMLHPNVLKAAGLDPEVYSGLAFGWGVERTYMMKEGLRLDDLRTLYQNDLRFLKQF